MEYKSILDTTDLSSVRRQDYYHPIVKIIAVLGYEWQGRTTIYKAEISVAGCPIGTTILKAYKIPPSILEVYPDGTLDPKYKASKNWNWIIRNYNY